MKILLSHAYYMEEDPKEAAIQKPYVPLGILSLAGFLEVNGRPCEVLDATFLSRLIHRNKILEYQPDILALYVNLMTKLEVLQLLAWVWSEPSLKNCQIILGGPEVRHHDEAFLNHGADYIIRGEGELSLLELIESISKNGESLNQVAGISYLAGDVMVRTGEREKIKDLDTLPFPARDKVDLGQYMNCWKQAHGQHSLSISTMRGCPYTCKWCSRAVYGLSYRRRSPEKVVEEMKLLKSEYNPDALWFVDDVFTISHKWLKQFKESVIQADAVIPYECISRADRLNEEVLQLLKKSGCFRVWIGAESGSQKVIDAMDRRVDVMDTREKIRQARAAGLEAGTFIMLGYPGETEADILETTRHLMQSNPHHFTITLSYPITGTELHDEVEGSISGPAWEKGNDRDKNFSRAYPRPYYDHAIRYVTHKVQAHQAILNKQYIRAFKSGIKFNIARASMWRWRIGA